ncbi:MAG TPA: group II intron reverse transcriptase/maturase [Williamwhitmania sp.]|nr:group II intron reverse transcriptase/maturase [Williamwhitmania sp.]
MIFEIEQKTQPITTEQINEAFKRVRANWGSYGIDHVSIAQVDNNKRKYLYPLWNRMASGSYFPKAVRQSLISKGCGKLRALGIPIVIDRVAQQVIAAELENMVDKTFSDSSYGYRPNKSAHQAIEQCRINCMKYSWVIDIDIKGFFDNVDHDLLMKAVQWHTDKKHILLYCKRWLEAPVRKTDGTIQHPNGVGTPQGGVISPILANTFLDVVFDKWIEKRNPEVVYERYADDIVIHCSNIKEALRLLEAIKERFRTCKLEVNKDKTKIVYCRRNQKKRPPFKVYYQKFDFLGFTFKPRIIKERGKLKLGFSPAISQKSIARINDELRKLKIHRWTYFSLSRIGEILKSKIRGWLNYYSKFRRSELRHLFRDFNKRLAKWIRNKYRRFRRRHWYHAYKYLQSIAKRYPYMFEHWKVGFMP